MKTYNIAVIAGDGIGKEVIPAGMQVLRMAAEQGGFRCDFTELPWGCDFYLKTGRMMDADGVAQVMKFDAIYLGAIGDPQGGGPHLGPRNHPSAAPAASSIREPASHAAPERDHVAVGEPRPG